MSLPKLTVTKHKLKLPSTGEEILYRPFLVKEEKILMMRGGVKIQLMLFRRIERCY